MPGPPFFLRKQKRALVLLTYNLLPLACLPRSQAPAGSRRVCHKPGPDAMSDASHYPPEARPPKKDTGGLGIQWAPHPDSRRSQAREHGRKGTARAPISPICSRSCCGGLRLVAIATGVGSGCSISKCISLYFFSIRRACKWAKWRAIVCASSSCCLVVILQP